MWVFGEEDALPVAVVVPLGVDDLGGPTLPDPETQPLMFYSVLVTQWDELGAVGLGFVSIEDVVLLAPTLSGVALVSPTLTDVDLIPD